MPTTVDLSRNPKQGSFFNVAIAAAFGFNPFRYLFYGGAIRGGKTFASLAILVVLCKMFPGSKWYVIRKSFARIQETTLPTMGKILGRTPRVKWNRDKSNCYVEFLSNGSRIYFAGEDIDRDPNLLWMLGLECNGFFLEQVEELSQKTFQMCLSRTGSWYVDPMPTPIILGSFNPTMTWVRTLIYDPWLEGKLEEPFYYQDALPDDNPWVTEEQWKTWQNMDDNLYAQFVKGSWDFAKPPNVFAYAFDQKKHHAAVFYDDNYPAYLSFDFNVEPITCLCAQHDLDWIRIYKEYRLITSDLELLCDRILADHPNGHFIVTGDSNGNARTHLKRNLTSYKVIKSILQLSPLQLKVPRANPKVRNTRTLTNSLFSKHPSYHVNTLACPNLTIDLNSVEVKPDGEIDKDKDKRKTHLLDGLRYYNWTFHRSFLDNSFYQYAGND